MKKCIRNKIYSSVSKKSFYFKNYAFFHAESSSEQLDVFFVIKRCLKEKRRIAANNPSCKNNIKNGIYSRLDRINQKKHST